MKYKPIIVLSFFRDCGLPEPVLEYQFHPSRKWRFDFAWPNFAMSNGHRVGTLSGSVALEVDGGIWIHGGHNRGAQLKKTWEKENEAQIMGWKIIKCEPKDLCTTTTADLVKRALAMRSEAPSFPAAPAIL